MNLAELACLWIFAIVVVGGILLWVTGVWE
jgi:hypothetical protein